jgi:hypothetical protein
VTTATLPSSLPMTQPPTLPIGNMVGAGGSGRKWARIF